MVRKTGFDPVASCTPSTRSAWLSYVLMKVIARTKRVSASKDEDPYASLFYTALAGEWVEGAGFAPASPSLRITQQRSAPVSRASWVRWMFVAES